MSCYYTNVKMTNILDKLIDGVELNALSETEINFLDNGGCIVNIFEKEKGFHTELNHVGKMFLKMRKEFLERMEKRTD